MGGKVRRERREKKKNNAGEKEGVGHRKIWRAVADHFCARNRKITVSINGGGVAYPSKRDNGRLVQLVVSC